MPLTRSWWSPDRSWPPHDPPSTGAGGDTCAFLRPLPVTAVPHGAATLATLASCWLDRGHLGCGCRGPERLVQRAAKSRGSDHDLGRNRGVIDLRHHRTIGALAHDPL